MLVMWFRNGKLYKAQACSARSWRRTANAWNEYAQLWNKRYGYEKNVVGIVPGAVLWSLVDLCVVERHQGMPKHLPKRVLEARRKFRELMRFPGVGGKWKN